MKMNKKGFTLIEMLVVIAIIAVLVSIVIPTVTSATEKAKEAADAANIRAAIAEVTTNALAGGDKLEETVTLTQTGKFDKLGDDLDTIGGIDPDTIADENTKPGQVVKITWDEKKGEVSVSKAADATPN